MDASLGLYLNAAGGLLVVLLGLWVATRRPRTPAASAFAVFATGFGGVFLANNGMIILHAPDDARLAAQTALNFVWLGGGVALALFFPRLVGRRDRVALGVAGVAAVLPPLARLADPAVTLIDFLVFASWGSLSGFLVLVAGRFAYETDAGNRRQFALAAAGILCYYGLVAGRRGTRAAALDTASNLADSLVFAGVLASGLMWLAATRGPDSRIARNLAFATFAWMLLGAAENAQLVRWNTGLSRALMALVLAYAIVRHQMLGLDVKARFAISKSTVAAIFVAVFFVASEAAQQFFGDRFESGYLGILAAGALVFAIAPLSRLADRFAESALPVAAAAPAPSVDMARLAAYREAARYTLRDGKLTRQEEAHLVGLAEHLGIPASEAMRVRHEVEDEGRRS